ncbi:MAG TPA: HAMP domain-containing sensor histidine kinase [Candidatus Tyrphobacter sp.]
MASDTAFAARKLAPLRALASPLVASVTQRRAVPLLVLRLPEFEEIAWQKGMRVARALERETTRAFVDAARGIVRAGDALAHDRGSDRFVVAMLAGSREGRAPSAADCRMTLERLAAAIARQTGRRMESGWWAVERVDGAADLERAMALALERGARERERYEFLAAIGHELRTPLSSIRGYLESVLDEEIDPRRTRRFLETARREALRLGRMVDGMLEFSLLDLSPPALASQTCDARECIAAAIDSLAPAARRRGVRLECDAPGTATLRIDADACMHALLNLVDNAVRYCGENGTVRIACVCEEGYASIVVDDDGPGMGAAGTRGHGLGLAIARTIAEHAGGAVRLDSSERGGVCARLLLPEAAVTHPKAEIAESTA